MVSVGPAMVRFMSMHNRTSVSVVFLLIFLILPNAHSVEISAIVTNFSATVLSIETFSMFNSHTDNLPEDNFFVCVNDDRKVYVKALVQNPDGFEGIVASFEISTLNQTIESDFEGLPQTPLHLYETISDTTAIFGSGFEMLRTDPERISPNGYRIRAQVSKGSVSLESPCFADFSLHKKRCMSYFNDSVKMARYSNTLVQAKSEVDTEIRISTSNAVNGTVFIVKTLDSPVDFNWVSHFIRTGQVALSGYYNITVSPGLLDALYISETRVYYSESELSTRGISEDSLRLYVWDTGTWSLPGPSGVDKVNNYVWALVDAFGTYTIIGNPEYPNPENETTEAAPTDICKEKWKCDAWSNCSTVGLQRRICTDKNDCGTEQDKPAERKKCIPKKRGKKPPSQKASEIELEESPEQDIAETLALFDINTEILSQTETQLLVKIGLLNFGDPGLIYVDLDYIISDDSNRKILEQMEQIPVETQTEFLKTFDISEYEQGNYTLLIDLKYKGQKEPAQAKKSFVIENAASTSLLPYILVIIASLCVLVSLVWIINNRYKNKTA